MSSSELAPVDDRGASGSLELATGVELATGLEIAAGLKLLEVAAGLKLVEGLTIAFPPPLRFFRGISSSESEIITTSGSVLISELSNSADVFERSARFVLSCRLSFTAISFCDDVRGPFDRAISNLKF